MRIKRFIESLENDEINKIKSYLIDFEDRTDFEFEISVSNNFINIKGSTDKLQVEKIVFMNEIINLLSLIKNLGYKNLDRFNVISLLPGKCQVQLQFVDELEQEIKVPDINSFIEFKSFIETTLALKFMEWDSELYIPNNSPDRDLMIEFADGHFIISGSPYSINWNIFKPEFKKFLEPLIIKDKERLAHTYYDIDGSIYKNYPSWAAVKDDDGKEVSKEEIKLLQKSYKEKLFKFDKSGAKLIVKIYEFLKDKSFDDTLYLSN